MLPATGGPRQVTPEERAALLGAAGEVRQFEAGTHILEQGSQPRTSTLLISGLTSRYNLLENGKRQITSFHVAGDFVDLHSFVLKTMDHGVLAMTRVTVMAFLHSSLDEITERHPHLTRMLWLSTLLEGAIHRQWIVAKGKLTAAQHMAHLFCEMCLRYEVVGLSTDRSFPFPLTQNDLGDAMGLSPVHVNRSIQNLRARGMVEWQRGMVKIADFQRLRDFAQFDEAFLHIQRMPR